MAKIDTSKIEGYATMTPDQKLAALEALELEDSNSEVEKYKNAASKANTEAAELKRQLKTRMTEDEQKEADRAAKEAEKDKMLESLMHEKAVSDNKAKFLALGYDEKLAAETADALAKGEMDKVFANQKTHLENREKTLKAEILKDTPYPPSGNPTTGADFAKQLEAAQASGDFVQVAALMRQQQEAANPTLKKE